jgi:hypothetical protein
MNVYYPVPLIPQSTNMSCWAAGIAMILAWRGQMSIDPSTIAANQGGTSYLPQMHSGLDANDTAILRRWGFVTEPPQSYTPEGFANLLVRHGPLWVAAAVPGPHIRVVSGIMLGPTAENTAVWINDPWEVGMRRFRMPNHGSQYFRTYLQFTTEAETLARREVNEPAPVYVAHLP